MPDAVALRVRVLGEDSALLGSFDAPASSRLEGAMERARESLEPSARESARGARLDWVGSDGSELFWCEAWWTRPSDFDIFRDRQPGSLESRIFDAIRRVPVSARVASPPKIVQPGPCSYALMPDFGDASLWEAGGANAGIEPEDARPGFELLAEAWERRVSRWQLVFEAHVDENEPGREIQGAPAFEWAEFESRAAALALASRSCLARAVRVRHPAESPNSNAPDWLPDWEETDELARRACERLELFDEEGFAELLAQGARQSEASPMPWAVYCAHMGLARALGELASALPGEARRRCRWGACAWSAVLARQDPAAGRALEAAGVEPPEGFGLLWPQRLAWRAPEAASSRSLHRPDPAGSRDALEFLAILRRVAPMRLPPSLPPEGVYVPPIRGALRAAWEARELDASLGAAQASAGSRPRGAL